MISALPDKVESSRRAGIILILIDWEQTEKPGRFFCSFMLRVTDSAERSILMAVEFFADNRISGETDFWLPLRHKG